MADFDVEEFCLARQRVYTGRTIALDVDRVRLADGLELPREVIRHPGAVVVIAVCAGGDIVLERQFRYAAGRVLIEAPAGTLNPGEDPLACAVRELAEETGRHAREWSSLGSFFTAPGFCDEQIHAFLARGAEPAVERSLDDDEHIEVFTLAPAAIRELVGRGAIEDAKTLAALALAGVLAG